MNMIYNPVATFRCHKKLQFIYCGLFQLQFDHDIQILNGFSPANLTEVSLGPPNRDSRCCGIVPCESQPVLTSVCCSVRIPNVFLGSFILFPALVSHQQAQTTERWETWVSPSQRCLGCQLGIWHQEHSGIPTNCNELLIVWKIQLTNCS